MKKIIIPLFSTLFLCGALVKAVAADPTWLTDLPKAEAQAKAGNKLVLLDFTGSDWCIWCKRMEADTFAKPEFASYASTNLVLVRLDFPQETPQSDDLKKANAALQKQYNVEGFPTIIALKPDGTVVWTQVGYLEGGPAAFIAALNQAKK